MPLDFLFGTFFDIRMTLTWVVAFAIVFTFVFLLLRKHLRRVLAESRQLTLIIWSAIGLILVLRVAYVLVTGERAIILADGYYHRAVALYNGQGLANEYGNPTALWMPGYSVLLASAFRMFGGPSYSVVLIIQLVLGFVCMMAVYRLASSLFDRATALIATLIIGLFPSQIILASFAQSDLAFTTFLWMGIAFFLSDSRNDAVMRRYAILGSSGLLFGWASLTRPYGFVFVMFYFGWYLYSTWRKDRKRLAENLRAVAFVAILVCSLLGLWVLRNYSVFGRFVPFSTAGGINLWVANHPGSSGRFDGLPGEFYSLTRPEDEIALDDSLRAQAVAYILSDPVSFITKMPKKWVFLFASDSTLLGQVLERIGLADDLLKNSLAGFANAYYLMAFVMAFTFCTKRLGWLLFNKIGSFGIVVFASMLAIFAVFHVETRFHIPIIPAIALYSAAFVRYELLK